MTVAEHHAYQEKITSLGLTSSVGYFNNGSQRYANFNLSVLFNPREMEQVDLSCSMPEFKVFVLGHTFSQIKLETTDKRLVLKKSIDVFLPYLGVHIATENVEEISGAGFLGSLHFMPLVDGMPLRRISFWWNNNTIRAW